MIKGGISNYGEGNTALEKEDAQGNLKQYRKSVIMTRARPREMEKIWHEFKTVDRGERPSIFSAKKPSAFSYMEMYPFMQEKDPLGNIG